MKNKNNSTLQIGTTGGGNLSYGSNGIVDLKPFPGFEDPVVKKQMTNGEYVLRWSSASGTFHFKSQRFSLYLTEQGLFPDNRGAVGIKLGKDIEGKEWAIFGSNFTPHVPLNSNEIYVKAKNPESANLSLYFGDTGFSYNIIKHCLRSDSSADILSTVTPSRIHEYLSRPSINIPESAMVTGKFENVLQTPYLGFSLEFFTQQLQNIYKKQELIDNEENFFQQNLFEENN